MSVAHDIRSRRRALSADERAEVIRLLRTAGRTQQEIADQFGIHRNTVGGIARDLSGTRRDVTTKQRPVSVLPTVDELAGLDRVVELRGFRSRNHLLRHLMRVAAEVYDAEPEVSVELADMAAQLRGVAVNINQMARAANRGKLGWTEQDKAEMSQLARGCGELSRTLSSMVAGSARKGRADLLLGRGRGDG